MLSASQEKAINEFNRNVSWLRKNAGLIQQQPEWISYEDAFIILPRSKDWYEKQRLGQFENGKRNPETITLHRDSDWRMDGKKVEYKRSSVEALKLSIVK